MRSHDRGGVRAEDRAGPGDGDARDRGRDVVGEPRMTVVGQVPAVREARRLRHRPSGSPRRGPIQDRDHLGGNDRLHVDGSEEKHGDRAGIGHGDVPRPDRGIGQIEVGDHAQSVGGDALHRSGNVAVARPLQGDRRALREQGALDGERLRRLPDVARAHRRDEGLGLRHSLIVDDRRVTRSQGDQVVVVGTHVSTGRGDEAHTGHVNRDGGGTARARTRAGRLVVAYVESEQPGLLIGIESDGLIEEHGRRVRFTVDLSRHRVLHHADAAAVEERRTAAARVAFDAESLGAGAPSCLRLPPIGERDAGVPDDFKPDLHGGERQGGARGGNRDDCAIESAVGIAGERLETRSRRSAVVPTDIEGGSRCGLRRDELRLTIATRGRVLEGRLVQRSEDRYVGRVDGVCEVIIRALS